MNTEKNGTCLEETVYRNNLEAAKKVASATPQRYQGIVIDFVDMEKAQHRNDVMKTFRDELARTKLVLRSLEFQARTS